MSNFISWLLAFVGGIAITFIVCIILSFPTMWLWNWLMPTIFGLGKITVLQAFGLEFLFGLLFNTRFSIKTSES